MTLRTQQDIDNRDINGITTITITDIAEDTERLLEDNKAVETKLLDIRMFNSLFDYFIVTTGSSRVHCRALAREVREYLYSMGLREAMRPDMDSEWIIVDFNDIVVHIFTEETRNYYQLEKLWTAHSNTGPVSR